NALEAVFYQHTQPPLYNLYLALGLQFDEPHEFWVWSARAMGLVLHLALYGLIVRLGVRNWIAIFVAIAFAFSPASILCEPWLFYTFACAMLLACCGYWFHRAVASGRSLEIAIAFTWLALVLLTRSLFHVAWMVVAIVIALLGTRMKKRVLIAAALPLLL